jgi:hypothetical protein
MPRPPQSDRPSDHDLLIDIRGKVSRLETDLAAMSTALAGKFVTKEAFEGLQHEHEKLEKIVYGIVSIPLVGFLMGLVYLVWSAARK